MRTSSTILRAHAFVASALVLLAGSHAFAQGLEQSPLDYRYEYPRIGGELGLTSVWQTGAYDAGCGHFVEGGKINPIIALAYDRPMGGGFRFEALLGYQGKSVSSSYNSREKVVLNTNNGLVRADVDFENVGRATFSYFFLLPSMKLYITNGLFVGAGVNAGLLATRTTQYTKNILSKTVNLGELGISTVAYPSGESSDPYSKVYPEEEIKDANGVGLDAAFYVGGEFPISKRFKLGPRLLYSLPLIPVVSQPEELKLNSLQFLIGIRYNLFQ
jgi:hypothetical protein